MVVAKEMKKGFVVIILTMCLLTSSLFSVMALDIDYLYGPLPYFERISNTFQNFPDIEYLSYRDEWLDSKPEYSSLFPSFPVWRNESIDKWSEVPKAIQNFMNNTITYVRYFFSSLGDLFPNLWNNISECFRHWFTPVRVTLENMVAFFDALINSRDWFVCMGLAFIPCDWQRLQAEGEDLRVPLFGKISNYPINEYFNKRVFSLVEGD